MKGIVRVVEVELLYITGKMIGLRTFEGEKHVGKLASSWLMVHGTTVPALGLL